MGKIVVLSEKEPSMIEKKKIQLTLLVTSFSNKKVADSTVKEKIIGYFKEFGTKSQSDLNEICINLKNKRPTLAKTF